jgi:thiol-disulfide isomerase/thioredoxin
MSRGARLAAGVLAVAVLAVVAVLGLKSSGASGRAAPALPGESLVGPRVTLASMSSGDGGRPFAVVFWASWCGPCIHEAPAVAGFAASPAGKSRIVAVDWSDARSGAVAFVRRYRWRFPVLRDGEGTVGNDYRLGDLPTTFVVSGGRIRRTMVGPQTQASLTAALRSVEAS